MIYQVKNHEKIPLGTQFDNSWEIEYNRDLSSQLSGKTEWTATEDCWFQCYYIWVREGERLTNDRAYIMGLKLQVNNTVVAEVDQSGTTTINPNVCTFFMSANLLLKKGDTIKIVSTGSEKNPISFYPLSTKVFPIHRILSKQEGSVEVAITFSMPGNTTRTYTKTAYPLGNNLYIVPYMIAGYMPPSDGYEAITITANRYIVQNALLSAWQEGTGAPLIGDISKAETDADRVFEVKAVNNSKSVYLHGSILLERSK